MSELAYADGLSPLDQIRLVEAEITRKIVAARDASEHKAADARAQAAVIKKEAEARGIRAGQIRCKETVAKAEEQAQVIVAHANREADDLRQAGQLRMDSAVAQALQIILGVKRDAS